VIYALNLRTLSLVEISSHNAWEELETCTFDCTRHIEGNIILNRDLEIKRKKGTQPSFKYPKHTSFLDS
jgi:hypothetical protein